MKVVIQYREHALEYKFDAECTIVKKRFTFTNVLCKYNSKLGMNIPIEIEQNQIDKIIAMYELDPGQFNIFDVKKQISVGINKRLNPATLIHGHLPEKNKVISKEGTMPQQKNKDKKAKRTPVSTTRVREYDPEYNPNDALNRRVKGSYW